MATINTGYTWVSGNVVTPALLNQMVNAASVSDVSNADISASAAIAGSKLAAGGVGTTQLADAGVTQAKLADGAVSQAKLAANVTGNGPAFRAFASTPTSIPNITWTKVNLQVEGFDTNNNFASGRFTPTVAGYYMILASLRAGDAVATLPIKELFCGIAKNGVVVAVGSHFFNTDTYISTATNLMFMNGSSDYVELYAFHSAGSSQDVGGQFPSSETFLAGFLARAA